LPDLETLEVASGPDLLPVPCRQRTPIETSEPVKLDRSPKKQDMALEDGG